MIFVACLTVAALAAESAEPVVKVARIEWSRFKLPVELDQDYLQARKLLLGCARYNVGWLHEKYTTDNQLGGYTITPPAKPGQHEHTFRAPCTIAFLLAVALRTGVYDPSEVGISPEECLSRARKLIRGLVVVHKSNGDARLGWGNHWQSALWATLVAQAGWMLWEDLDPETQRMVVKVTEYEADRFIAPDYRVPYWADREQIISPGNTRAEENAWNAMILQLAVAMLPDHPHSRQWRECASELMVSSYARRQDMDDEQSVVDGRTVKAWLHGYNVRDDGAVINHRIVHPDYITSITSVTRAYLTLPLVGRKVPQSANFNAAWMYRTLVVTEWPSPPYEAPGGTIYRPGEADIYYPNGTDWSRFNYADYYLTDVNAHVLGWDRGLPHPAADWMRARATRMVQMQLRHPDRRMYAPGEWETYPNPEAASAWMIADAFLLHWLNATGAIHGSENWLAKSWGRVEPRGKEILGPTLGEFVFIPGGEFTMGRNDGENENERLEHVVELSSFYIGRSPVTNSQFVQFLNEARVAEKDYGLSQKLRWQTPPILFADEKWSCVPTTENDAVSCQNWRLAERYCEWLSAKTQKNCRLPTEAEWEYTCRGKEGRKFPWSKSAIVDEPRTWSWRGWSWKKPNKIAVGSYPAGATPEGVCDLIGYMDEVCSDWYDPNYYAVSPQMNPKGPSKPQESVAFKNTKVARGGLDRPYMGGSYMVRLLRDSKYTGILPRNYLPRGWSRGAAVPPSPRITNGRLGFRVVIEGEPAPAPEKADLGSN